MYAIPGFLQKIVFCQIALMLFYSFVNATPVPLRLDIYNGSDNHLMYMTFRYNAEGRTTGRTIYMADETFMRDVAINYDSLGRRLNEVSYNFNGDTMYVTNFLQAENGTMFNISDQFKLDLTGDRVIYSNADPLNFGLMYKQSGEQAAAVRYTKDAISGQLRRVDIAGRISSDSYYGLFTYGEPAGVLRIAPKAGKLPQTSIQSRASRIDVNFNLQSAGDVRCELLTLSGRRAAVLWSGRIQKGSYSRHFNIDKDAGLLSEGVYLFKVSVNGEGVSHSKYLYQSSAGGFR